MSVTTDRLELYPAHTIATWITSHGPTLTSSSFKIQPNKSKCTLDPFNVFLWFTFGAPPFPSDCSGIEKLLGWTLRIPCRAFKLFTFDPAWPDSAKTSLQARSNVIPCLSGAPGIHKERTKLGEDNSEKYSSLKFKRVMAALGAWEQSPLQKLKVGYKDYIRITCFLLPSMNHDASYCLIPLLRAFL